MRAAAAAALLIAGCSGEPAPAPTPSATPSPTPAPTPVAAIDDRPQPRPKAGGIAAAELPAPELEGPVAAGGWTLKASATGSAALFGEAGREPRFAIRCDPQGKAIVFALAGRATGGQLRIVTATGSARFTAQPTDLRELTAVAPAQYTFVTQNLARKQGEFAVQVDDGDPLRLPWGEPIGQVIRSCQPG